ncbi:GHMP kinase [Flavobacteriaceae bacterium TP-CH-4]|uniref:GHMP kinase n=1 Tax=Pelagihabitans pacificus TaxID=2696054 RepID=A0A967AX54_9FLAO|nr:GYDIA family GHMP kinase [Pelagihabitans pacificus]NHF61524.1 GHMP kinase [Pelagihabitans pacificus]
MTTEYYSNGKLLISGEYVILDGALGWAIPTKYGQYLRVEKTESDKLSWKSLDHLGQLWFEGTYRLPTFEPISFSDQGISMALQTIFSSARGLNPSFLKRDKGYEVHTELTFPKDWGLGSSSTLINNIAQWVGIDPYELLKNTFGGSGYDIACAKHNTPLLYRIENGVPHTNELELRLPFQDSLYFVYLNQKKNSREAISAYRKLKIETRLIEQITQITRKLVATLNLKKFEELLLRHELLLSEALKVPTVQSELFEDYFGVVKSLGAWGGDFVLATGNQDSPGYFKEKGYDVVIPFSEMLL